MKYSGMVYKDVELACGLSVVVEAEYDGEDFSIGIFREDGEDITMKFDMHCHSEFANIECQMAEAIIEDVAQQIQEGVC